jgi:lipopolysaccharide biosynthesis glycosyltransferase
MVQSLVERLRPGAAATLYLVHDDLTQESIDLVGSIVDTVPIVPSASQAEATPTKGRFRRQAAYPLLLAELLPPTVERVLFLDVDLLVLDDVSTVFATDLGDHAVAAAPDVAIPTCSDVRGVKGWRERGIPQGAPYFNCGVLLIDLGRWRDREITPRVHDYLRTTEHVDFLHQEALNAVLWDDWRALDRRWNLLASQDGRSYQSPVCTKWRDPGIVHFSGRMKPWRAPIGGPFDAPYRDVLERVSAVVPRDPPRFGDRLISWYDRYARHWLHPVERALWQRRLF